MMMIHPRTTDRAEEAEAGYFPRMLVKEVPPVVQMLANEHFQEGPLEEREDPEVSPIYLVEDQGQEVILGQILSKKKNLFRMSTKSLQSPMENWRMIGL